MKRILLILTVLLTGGIVLRERSEGSTQLSEISARLQGQILTASNRLANARSSVDSQHQELTSESAESDSVIAELAEVGRRRSQASSSTGFASAMPPADLPSWMPKSPHIWLEKPLLKRMNLTVLRPDGTLTPTAADILAIEAIEAEKLGKTLKRILAEHLRQETAGARVIQEHLPEIAKEEGPKFTLRIDPVKEAFNGLRTKFEATLGAQLGNQRMELLKGSIENGLSDLFGKQATQVRTLSFVRLPSGVFQMAEHGGARVATGTEFTSGFGDIRLHVPEHLHPLIPPEFLEKPPEPDQP